MGFSKIKITNKQFNAKLKLIFNIIKTKKLLLSNIVFLFDPSNIVKLFKSAPMQFSNFFLWKEPVFLFLSNFFFSYSIFILCFSICLAFLFKNFFFKTKSFHSRIYLSFPKLKVISLFSFIVLFTIFFFIFLFFFFAGLKIILNYYTDVSFASKLNWNFFFYFLALFNIILFSFFTILVFCDFKSHNFITPATYCYAALFSFLYVNHSFKFFFFSSIDFGLLFVYIAVFFFFIWFVKERREEIRLERLKNPNYNKVITPKRQRAIELKYRTPMEKSTSHVTEQNKKETDSKKI